MSKNRSNRTIYTDEELIAELREMVPEGSTVHTRVEHVSQSGMSRNIVPIVALPDGDIVNLSWHCWNLGIGSRPRGRYAGRSVTMGGCGMDMTFALVYDLAAKLYGDGYKLNNRNY